MDTTPDGDSVSNDVVGDKQLLVQFRSENGDVLGSPFDMPTSLTKEQLQTLCDALLQKVLYPNVFIAQSYFHPSV